MELFNFIKWLEQNQPNTHFKKRLINDGDVTLVYENDWESISIYIFFPEKLTGIAWSSKRRELTEAKAAVNLYLRLVKFMDKIENVLQNHTG